MTVHAPMPADAARAIAQAFLPNHPLGNRYDYYYTQAKLRSDPLYAGVTDALRDTDAPLLDLGCGLGLLAHALRAGGVALAYRGVDIAAGKVARAQRAAARAALADATFEARDLAAGLPTHAGSVAILDVLQFVPPEAQPVILDAAIAMLMPGARLVIRTGFDDGSARARTTRRIDVLSRLVGWMNATPKRYPDRDDLQRRFDAAGLRARFAPLHGDTPFNNWLVVAERPRGEG